VSLSGDESEGFKHDLLTAKERDLKPLLDESTNCLGLDYDQTLSMEAFLNEAWFAGTRSGHAQMRERANQRRFDVGPVGLDQIEARFKALMEESADVLNLTIGLTIRMWGFLGQAWLAGTHTSEAELMATFIALRSDVAEEALEWLEGNDEKDDG
jgi:hypothetical protein